MLDFRIVSGCSVYCLGYVLESEVQEHFILLVTVRVKECFETADIAMFDQTHDLQFPVLDAKRTKVNITIVRNPNDYAFIP